MDLFSLFLFTHENNEIKSPTKINDFTVVRTPPPQSFFVSHGDITDILKYDNFFVFEAPKFYFMWTNCCKLVSVHR